MNPSRFWRHVLNRDDHPDSCWLWCGAQNDSGYGIVRVSGRLRTAHRVAYELQVGPIPEGITVRHTCGDPACVRGDHLTLDRPYRKLGDQDVEAIRSAHGSHNAIGRKFAVSGRHVCDIRHWKRRACG